MLSLPKANFYLETTIDLVNKGLELDSRIVQFLNQSPVTGGSSFASL
jgi:aminopeptidase C